MKFQKTAVYVVMVHKERSGYLAAREAFDNLDDAEKAVEHQMMQGGVRSWIEEITLHTRQEKQK